MQTTVDSAGDVLAALEHAPAATLVAVDLNYASQDRVQAAFEAMAPNTRRAYGSALRSWGRWAAAQQVSGLCPSPPDLRSYLLERASEGAGVSSLTVFVSALRKLQALAAIYETACFPHVGRGGTLDGSETALRRGLVDLARWDNGPGRLTVRRSKTDATPRTVYLTPVAMTQLDAIGPTFGFEEVNRGLFIGELFEKFKGAEVAFVVAVDGGFVVGYAVSIYLKLLWYHLQIIAQISQFRQREMGPKEGLQIQAEMEAGMLEDFEGRDLVLMVVLVVALLWISRSRRARRHFKRWQHREQRKRALDKELRDRGYR